MSLLYHLMPPLEIKRDEWEIRRELARLDARSLAHIGLERADIRRVARRTVRLGPSEPLTWVDVAMDQSLAAFELRKEMEALYGASARTGTVGNVGIRQGQ